jgi:hypothetical protein
MRVAPEDVSKTEFNTLRTAQVLGDAIRTLQCSISFPEIVNQILKVYTYKLVVVHLKDILIHRKNPNE